MGSIRGNSFYEIVNGSAWTQADANAVDLGGHLVTVNDQAENAWLVTTFNITEVDAKNKNVWIGLYNSVNTNSAKGIWRWSSGESVSYQNWNVGQPDGESGEVVVLGRFANGLWNDQTRESSDWGPRFGIAEIPLSYYSISDITVTEGSTGSITISRTGGTTTAQNLTLTSSNGTANS
jgi:hypothetical protein